MYSDKEKPLFSFLLFAYNQEKYIREAVLGALNQTYSPLEIVISDDCSTDRTWEIIRDTVSDYKGSHKIILNRNEQNAGWAQHINEGVKLTHGRWIVVAAGDDISYPNRVEMVNEVAGDRDDVFYVGTAITLLDEKGRHCGDGPIDLDTVLRLPGCMAAYRRECFTRFDELDMRILTEDLVLPFRSLLLGKIVLVDKPSVQYRSDASDYYIALKKGYAYLKAIIYAYEQRTRDIETCRLALPKNVLEGLRNANDKVSQVTGRGLTARKNVLRFYDAPLRRRLVMLFAENGMERIPKAKMFIQSFATLRRLKYQVKQAFSKPKRVEFTGAVTECCAQDLLDMKIRVQGFNCV